MITLEDVRSAARRISPHVPPTRLDRSDSVSEFLGTDVHLKLELFQKTGSFKPRGAFNQILSLDGRATDKGVVAVSGGNFGKGVAYAAKQLGIKATICMPAYTPPNYVEATRSYGATVELLPDFPSTFARAEALKGEGHSFLHAWDDPHQMAGNGTIGLEILEGLPDVTDIIISVGGGGLLAGITVAVKALKPRVRIWAVETEGSQTLGKALEAGKVVQITPTSLAKTLGATYVAEDALRIAQQHLERYVVVSDREAIDAQRFLLEQAKLLTELAASCTLAAASKSRESLADSSRVVLVLCGGNESLANMIAYGKLQ